MTDEKIIFRDKKVVVLMATIACALWGTAYPGIKIGYRLFHITGGEWSSQIIFAGERFTISGILVLLFAALSGRCIPLLKKKSIPGMFAISATQTFVQYIFFYIGLAHTSGVRSSIISALATFVAILFAGYLFHQEKITRQKMIGCLIGFTGIVLINLTGLSDGKLSFLGEGFLLLSTVMYALSACLIRLFSKDENPVWLSGWQFFCGGISLMAVGKLLGGTFRPIRFPDALILLYLGFLSACAYTIWSVLLKYNRVSTVTIYTFLTPIFGTLFSMLLLHERGEFGVLTGIALLLVSVGIFVVNKEQKS